MSDGTEQDITFEQAIITVGSRPYRPDLLDFSHPRVFDSDKSYKWIMWYSALLFMVQA